MNILLSILVVFGIGCLIYYLLGLGCKVLKAADKPHDEQMIYP